MKVREVVNRIFLVTCRTSRAVADIFVRFQEYYESPKFRGKIFTSREFLKWYRKTFETEYHDGFEGFNIPSSVLTPFYNGLFDPLNKKEKAFLRAFRRKKMRFYIIGAAEDDHTTLTHEIAHGLFFTNLTYRNEVILALGHSNLSRLYEFFKVEGYHPDVWVDEAHAYIVNDLPYLESRGVKVRGLHHTNEILSALFDRFYKPL